MRRLVFTFFGTFNVQVGDEPITGFRSDKERALLAYLALEAQKPLTRRLLATILWSEMSDQGALDNLRKTLYRLRMTLDAAEKGSSDYLLTVTRQSIQFNQPNAFVDVHVFQTQLDASYTHTHGQLHDCATCLARLDEATALYRGELLAGLGIADAPAFEEWLLLRREQLQQCLCYTPFRMRNGDLPIVEAVPCACPYCATARVSYLLGAYKKLRFSF